LKDHPVNTNVFFQAFKDQYLSRSQLQMFLRQYHYFCKHFVKVLEGLLYKTPVDALEMRVELAKTLHSELGNGCAEQAHSRLLERFADHDLVFFAMHLEAEECHSAWLTQAVEKTARTQADLERVAAGARTTADAWLTFWQGLYRDVFEKAAVGAHP